MKYVLNVTVPSVDVFDAYWYGLGEVMARITTAPSRHLAYVVDYGGDGYSAMEQLGRFQSGLYAATVDEYASD